MLYAGRQVIKTAFREYKKDQIIEAVAIGNCSNLCSLCSGQYIILADGRQLCGYRFISLD